MSPGVPQSLEGQECLSDMVSRRTGPVSRFLPQVTCLYMIRCMCIQSQARHALSDSFQEPW